MTISNLMHIYIYEYFNYYRGVWVLWRKLKYLFVCVYLLSNLFGQVVAPIKIASDKLKSYYLVLIYKVHLVYV